MAFKHSYMIITTNFELEPVLEQYLRTYPQGEFSSYQIVFKADNEHEEGNHSYIIVFTLQQSTRNNSLGFSEYLDAYCKLNNGLALASAVNNGFPSASLARTRSSGIHVFGLLPSK